MAERKHVYNGRHRKQSWATARLGKGVLAPPWKLGLRTINF